jgi:hypothetical protein
MKTKDLKLVLEKFLTSDAATNARVQVCLPNGEFYDISGMQLMENKLFGVRETHRLVITIEKEKWRMGQVIKKLYWDQGSQKIDSNQHTVCDFFYSKTSLRR